MRASAKLLIIFILFAVIVCISAYLPTDMGRKTLNGNTGTASAGGIIISEVMSNNGGIFPDDTGNNSDWAEFYNTTDKAIEMKNFALSDDPDELGKWPFPDVTLKPHEYLVVFLTGDKNSDISNGILHCSFKLKSSGEKLILSNLSNQGSETVDMPNLPGNTSYSFISGTWQKCDKPSPGFENTDNGFEAFKKSMVVNNSSVVISEVMASNNMTLKDGNGAYSDWVEITNTGKQDVNLKNYGLSDDKNKPLKWRFPDVTIKAGAFLVVFCSGETNAADSSQNAIIHTDYKLSSDIGSVTLSDKRGRLLDSLEYNELPADWSYTRTIENGKPVWHQKSQPTPGYTNTDAGFSEFMKNNPLKLGDIVISEVLTSNSQYDLEGDDHTYDCIEIENRGKSPVNLKGYGLTNNAGNPAKYRFPDITLQPGQVTVVLASGLNAAQAAKAKGLNAPYKLSKTGDTLALFNAQNQLIDRYYICNLPQNISIGRELGKSDLSYFTTPTLGQANGQGKTGIAEDVVFSQKAGIYKNTFQLTLTSPNGCDIYYTLDGNTPTQSSTKYSGPITVSKTATIRARAFKDNYVPSTAVTSTYFMSTSHTLPLISIVTDPANLFDPTNGIYELGPNPQLISGSTEHYQVANYLKRGQESERPASFEVYDEQGNRTFNQNIAIRIQGGFSRDNQQKSFAIIARSKYGPSSMEYQFFADLPYTEYKSIVLRDGGQDQRVAKIKEAVILNLVKGKINCLIQNIKPYVVYINGQYWGVYFMEEKRNKYFVAQHEGISDPDTINLLSGSGLSSGPTFVKNGTNKGYKELINYIQTHDLSQKANYDYVAARLDTDSFMDEMINEIYMANSDYYNMEFYQVPGGKWKQIFYDFCWTFQTNHETLSRRMADSTCGSTVFKALLKYEPWKKAFIERFAWTMKNIYPTERVLSVIDQMANAVASEMPAERAKFTDTRKNWAAEVEAMRSFAKNRPAVMKAQLKSVFALSDAEMQRLFG